MKIIDAHQHFWDPSRGDYSWMPQDNKILNRKYDLADLTKDSKSIELHKTVLVQAAATNAETEYIDYYTSEKMITPISSAPEPKRRFIPSKWERMKIYKIIRGINEGYIKVNDTNKQQNEPDIYLLWGDDDG